VDIAGYLAGRLSEGERARVEQHLAGCPGCRREAEELGGVVDLLELRAPSHHAPPGLADRAYEAVQRVAADGAEPVSPAPRSRRVRDLIGRGWRVLPRPVRYAAAGALAVAVGLHAYGDLFGDHSTTGGGAAPAGVLEIDAPFPAVSGGDPGRLVVTAYPNGRQIRIEADLPDVPKTYYEVWLVKPDDTVAEPHRVSAGTFHVDENGHAEIELASSAHPGNYPIIEVTREPKNDGDPGRTGPAVLRFAVGSDPGTVDIYRGDPRAAGDHHGG
jgi:hypothetical protein